MKLFDELNNDNFELYAVRYYNNPSCLSKEEFYEDLARFKYVLRLLRKYQDVGILQERLILNHLIIIYNVFEIQAANRMLFYRIDTALWSALKPFLIYLNYLPESSEYDNITIDLYVSKKLQLI